MSFDIGSMASNTRSQDENKTSQSKKKNKYVIAGLIIAENIFVLVDFLLYLLCASESYNLYLLLSGLRKCSDVILMSPYLG